VERKGEEMTRYVGLDPSTKTGFVALDEDGNVLKAKELTGVDSQDPKRMVTMIDDIIAHIQPDDFICIEGFGFATDRGIQLGGIGWGIRMALFRRGINYTEVSPGSVKKFCTGKGNTKKENMVIPIYKHWGFEHSSDNVRDAFVLAQIAKVLDFHDITLTKYQNEVIDTILSPPAKKPKKKKSGEKK
jgi:crossover junction endodeoxyribonuclease RuvC